VGEQIKPKHPIRSGVVLAKIKRNSLLYRPSFDCVLHHRPTIPRYCSLSLDIYAQSFPRGRSTFKHSVLEPFLAHFKPGHGELRNKFLFPLPSNKPTLNPLLKLYLSLMGSVSMPLWGPSLQIRDEQRFRVFDQSKVLQGIATIKAQGSAQWLTFNAVTTCLLADFPNRSQNQDVQDLDAMDSSTHSDILPQDCPYRLATMGG
jgi:hypothetical protein